MHTYVIKLGGAVCLESDTLDTLALGLKALRAAGHRPLLIHGGGPQIDAALAGLGEPTVKHLGLRRTSAMQMAVVRRALDWIGAELTAALVARGVPAAHIASDAQAIRAGVKALPDGFDLGRVGTFEGFDDSMLPAFAHSGATALRLHGPVPVVTPVGHDRNGPLNLNADEAAGGIAASLQAERLLLATDVSEVLDAGGRPIRSLDAAQARALISDGTAAGGMIPKLQAALVALEAGVASVLITQLAARSMMYLKEPVPSQGTLLVARRAVPVGDPTAAAEAHA
jgi:acetylglutamate kinase